MKKIKEEQKQLEEEVENDDVKQLEILKAVAQAWHAHSGSTKPTNEFDAYRRNLKTRYSRFRIDAMNKRRNNKLPAAGKGRSGGDNWDFRESLWDSYELVTVAKKLEAELVLDSNGGGNGKDNDDLLSGLSAGFGGYQKKKKYRRESKNSLRNLMNSFSSRRFGGEDDN